MNYQHLPNLSDKEYQALKADIKTAGVLVPVDIDEEGNILDGHHRIRACQELGIKNWPTVVRSGMSDQEKHEYVYRVNVNRRQLDKEWKRQEAERLAKKHWSQEEIGRALGIDQSTVGRWLDNIMHLHNTDLPTTRTDSLGRERPTTYKRREPTSVFAQTAQATQTVQQALLELGDDTKPGFVSKETVTKKAKKRKRKKEASSIAQRLKESPPKPSDRFTLFCGNSVEIMPTLEKQSIDVIITDPPYPKEYLSLYKTLAYEANRLLRPNGCLYVMVGQSYLPEIFNLMTPHITYRWTISYLTPGAKSAQLWNRKINTFWKPVLCFSRGVYQGEWTGDVIKSKSDDKRFHEWGQSESGMIQLIESYTKPNDVILDPFCGSGTTGVAALVLNRRFIGIDIEESNIAATKSRLYATLSKIVL